MTGMLLIKNKHSQDMTAADECLLIKVDIQIMGPSGFGSQKV